MTSLSIAGNLAGDPEFRITPNGKPLATFTIIASKSQKKPDGTWENTDVSPWSIKCWNKLAENVNESLRKGMGVIIQGTAVWDSWNDKKTGEKTGRISVTAFNVGVDLKRHAVQVVEIRRNGEGDAEIDQWSAPTWKKDAEVPESFPF
jgi:single-strand DNA-binding protein